MKALLSVIALGCIIGIATPVLAEEFTSSDFKVLDPVIAPAGYSTSASYTLWSTISQLGIGTSTAASFGLVPGFLTFPEVSTPAVSVTAGDAQASLSWTASEGFLGWVIGGYSVGQSSVSGGPYSYSSVGNVLSSTRTGLTNGTTYYFVIVVNDAFGNAIATSTQVSVTPASSGSGSGSGGGSGGSGGGGGGSGGTPPASSGTATVIARGIAYPGSKVNLLKDGQLVASTPAGPDAKFEIQLGGIGDGTFTFSIWAADANGERSTLFPFTVTLTQGVTTVISGIFIPPTVSLDLQMVRRGDPLRVIGQTAPDATVSIVFNSATEIIDQAKADSKGLWTYVLDTLQLEYGDHTTQARSKKGSDFSTMSKAVKFKVGEENIAAVIRKGLIGDYNSDGKVGLSDFSIMLYWYKRPLTDKSPKVDLNNDGKVDLIDFSIFAYHWTG